MAVHIKRDGQFFCKLDTKFSKRFKFRESHISFTEAHKVNLQQTYQNLHGEQLNVYCKGCVEEYYRRISKMKNPVIVS